MLTDIFQQIEKAGSAKSTKQGGILDIGVGVLPKLPRDAGDRNRTSPFAFTGNKFEFRAVGSSQNIARPNTIINAMVAERLEYVASELEKATGAGKDLNAAIQDLLPAMIREAKPVIFNGDNYSQEWHQEAEKRGLPNYKTCVEALPVLQQPDVVAVFDKYRVLSPRELKSRYEIFLEQYIKTINVEAKLTVKMAKTSVLPAALRYQREVAESLAAVKAAGGSVDAGLLTRVTTLVSELQSSIAALESASAHHDGAGLLEEAKHFRNAILAGMSKVREAADALEGVVADDLWPLPSYQEMLFIK